MAKFCDRLRLLRTSHNLSQLDFAKQLKLSKSSINMYERGEREPGIETLEAMADFFNVDLDYLLGKSDYPNKHIWLASVVDSKSGAIHHVEYDVQQDVLDEVDIAFYGDFKDLDEDDKETVRDMVRVMRERRARKQGK